MTSPPTTLLCQYRYDPLDRLIHQTQPDTPAHQRFYCKRRMATEIHGAMQQSIIQHGDLLLAQQQRLGDLVDTTLLLTDLQRSVLHSLKKDQQPQSIAYSPYGHRSLLSGLLSLLGFNGERPDPVTGCYLLGNGYRAFNPVLMRFNSPDSWSPFGKGGLNSYVYCLGDPVNQADPTGHVGGVGNLVKLFDATPNGAPPTNILPIRASPLSPPALYSRATPGVQGTVSGAPSKTVIARPVGASQSARHPAYFVDTPTPPPQSASDAFSAPLPTLNSIDVVNSSPTGSTINRSPPQRTLQPEVNASGVVNQWENARPTTGIQQLRQIRQQSSEVNTKAKELLRTLERMNRELEDALDPNFDD